ncbi:helix-turn-helix transcriptional regulator [Agriterribacter sp.]|uniref:helix-turn-helix domain-containing protein n=1 Tax=Agriterribacter sp. TaxID=2821509 RepID=UPI002BC897C2|nr:helix-turn-helix transcriptional regulator [Agriterribacter sp.]HRO46087.1 helix-turn-helix transcriptional regulator [Agriterribacter sp.]HRQ16147.1 helix-turn-helix transcriptional regulator [Agriterribacter sp.]
MKYKIGYRIRKLRESKDYSQQNMAGELGISTSAYSKIETGKTDPSIGRIEEIAAILDVDVSYFFQDENVESKVKDPNKAYGFATKSDMEELMLLINGLKREVENLKARFQNFKITKGKKV